EVSFAEFSWASWGALAFVVLGATWLAYVCVAASLKKLSPTTASIYSYSQPVIASIFAIIRGQDRLDFVKIAAALLVFIGVYIVTRSYKTEVAK
ncbi:MAG: DMT family transporter, partial [Mucinivorans sp.]